MAQGIIELIKENKRRFYSGELKNCFYDNDNYTSEIKPNALSIGYKPANNYQSSFWKNLKAFGQKFNDDIFYESSK